MKQIIISTSILIIAFQTIMAQVILKEKQIVFKVVAKDVHSNTIRGYLRTINDTQLVLSNVPLPLTFNDFKETSTKNLIYSDLIKIQLQRKASVGRGLLFGLIPGRSEERRVGKEC